MITERRKLAAVREPIAVVGLGCWYSGARNPLELWENVLSRRLEFRKIPDCRLPLDDYCDESGRAVDKIYATRAALLDGFDFDWIKRRIPKSLFDTTDLVHWLSVEVAEQALHDAGYTKETVDKAGTGVIVGNTLTGDITRAETVRLRWPYVRRSLQATCEAHGLSGEAFGLLAETMERTFKSVFNEPNADSLAGGLANTIAGRVCNYFDLHGGGYIVDGACSSSLLAVCTAARALSVGDLDAALVGGVDISIDPFELVGFSRAGALSKGDMRVYDKSAAGFIPGEGCGFVMLKRLEDARRDGNRVYAVLRGWGVSSDGKGGIMTPTSSGQALAIRRAYSSAGYSPADLDFVEGHGTGTSVGDVTELKGVFEAQTHPENLTQPTSRRTGMTSLKSIVGHTKAAAGIGAFIKATIAVHRRVLPPTGSCATPNPIFNEHCLSLYPLMHGTVLERTANVRAGVSAMGFGGINSHVTVESGDAPGEHLAPSLQESLLLVSNQTSEVFVLAASSLDLLAKQIDEVLVTAGDLSCSDLIDLSATLAERGSLDHPVRATVVASTVDELVQRLHDLADLVANQPPPHGEVESSSNQNVWLSNHSDRSRVGFLFPGQGSQQIGTARKLVARFDWAQEMVSIADAIQTEHGLPTLTQTVFADTQRLLDRDRLDAIRKTLARTEVAQIAIVTVSAIYSQYLRRMGIDPVACGGHSLGELTGLYQAGVLDFKSLLRLTSLRARAMAGSASPKGKPGTMAALACSKEIAQSLMHETPGYVVVANVNSTKQVVISGDEGAIQNIVARANEQQISATRLNVSNAFHSKYVGDAFEVLRMEAFAHDDPRPFDLDVYSCMDGQPIESHLGLREHVARQVIESVDFVSLVKNLSNRCDLLIEVGPGNVLTKLTQDILSSSAVSCSPSSSKPDVDCCLNRVLAKAYVHGVDVKWDRLFTNRFRRSFVPANDKLFIRNPCENDFSAIGDVEQIVSPNGKQTPSNSTEFVLQINDPCKDSATMIHNASSMSGPSQSQPADDGIEELIVGIIHERTGFPQETLTPDQRLLDDLNLDSLKAGDVVATATLQLGIQNAVEPTNLGDATIGDLVLALRQAKMGVVIDSVASHPQQAPAMLNSMLTSNEAHATSSGMMSGAATGSPMAAQSLMMMPETIQTPNCSEHASMTSELACPTTEATCSHSAMEKMVAGDWVRNFAIDFIQVRDVSEQLDLSNRHFRVLYDPSHEYFIELLARRFDERGATASFETYDNPGHVIGQAQPSGTSIYTVALLPREIPMGTSRDKLKRMIHRIHRAVATTKHGINQQPVHGITFVEFGNGRFGMEGMTDVERSGAAAFARAMHLESPSLQIRVVDFADELSDFLATDFITNEIASASPFCDAAYDRLGRRFETRHRLLQPTDDQPMPLAIGTGDVILVTGGARGITAECALALAQKTGASFALVGSSPHPSQASGAAADEIAATLERFAAFPGRCEYFTCDLADEHSVRQLVANVDAKLGRITGLIHGAGRNSAAAAATATEEMAMSEVAPKVLGAANLLESLSDRPLRCLIGLTSIIGVTGIPGNAWYGFSNQVLDLILRQYMTRHPETLVRSISYSAWSEVGMGAKGQVEKNLRRMGVGMIPMAEGVSRFMHAMEHAMEDPQVLVTGSLGGIDTWRPSGAGRCTGGRRFIGEVIEFEPSISLTTRVTLDHKQDPYLQDHIYSGTCLFPAVFGLEAMAQVAAHLVPDQPMIVRIQNVDLPKPIIVPQEGHVTLEIHAFASEKNADGEIVVSVGIRSERSQYQQDHFAAEIVFGMPMVGNVIPETHREPLDIDPQRDLYNGIMFQGPRFQRWGSTYHLERGLMRLDISHSESSCNGEAVFGEQVITKSLLTGDPFYRDVMLQSIQALIPQRIGLPLSIERIDFYAPAHLDAPQAERRFVTSKMNVIGDKVGDEHVCEVVAKDPCGHVREHMTGYRVKVLAIKDEYPTAEQLADLGAYDQMALTQQTTNAILELGLEVPVMRLQRMPHLHGLHRDERRVAERPLMEATASEWQRRQGHVNGAPKVVWLESGCPTIANDASCKLSLSHDEDYCLCIANSQRAGCDLAPVTTRSREQWEALLGTRNMPLLDQLTSHDGCTNKAGTRIWAATEAAKKSLDQAIPITLRVASLKDGNVALMAAELQDATIVTLPIALHRRPQRIIAIAAPQVMHQAVMTPKHPAPAASVNRLVSSKPKSLTPSKPLQPSQAKAASVSLLTPLSQPATNGGGLMPSKPRFAAAGHMTGSTPTQAEMLAMAKMATAAMSPDEAQMLDAMGTDVLPTNGTSAHSKMQERSHHQEASHSQMADASSNHTELDSISKGQARKVTFASPGEIRIIEDISALHKWDGPQDQAVFEYKFPVTFKECAKKGKHVQISQYVDWMGMLRENALLYLCPEIADKLFDGLSGMSTNWTDVEIVGELMMGDMVLARFFREEMTDSTINLVCDFCRLMPDGRLIRVAMVRQMTTWVALEGKKEPTKAAFPQFLADAFRKVAPRSSNPPQYMELLGNLGRLKLEQDRLKAVRSMKPVVVWAEEFQTTSADSNIVQNIYHSRYFNWQWRTCDLFLYNTIPQLVSSITSIGNVREMVPVSGHIDYFRDAFPFDRIRTELAVTRSTACAASLQFTHYRVLESGELQKLAVCEQDVVWVRRTPAATATPEPFPKAIRESLEASASMV